jgi:hypothetical protein
VVGEGVAGVLVVLARLCSSALLGMQPTLVQVPPGAGPPLSFLQALVDAGDVEASCAARMAAM